MNISKTLTNEGLYKFGKAAAGAVVATTILKAVGRPAFIMADKKSDPETKKYTATKEFMYQGICLLITLGMLPAFKVGGLKLTEKYLKNEPKLAGVAKKVAEAKFFGKNSKTKVFENELKKIKSAEERLLQIKQNKNPNEKPQVTSNRLKGMNAVNGGVELGAFVGSIIGLTILAPMISHEILHPVMKALGMDKKEPNVGKPNEVFLADAKAPIEKGTKTSTNA